MSTEDIKKANQEMLFEAAKKAILSGSAVVTVSGWDGDDTKVELPILGKKLVLWNTYNPYKPDEVFDSWSDQIFQGALSDSQRVDLYDLVFSEKRRLDKEAEEELRKKADEEKTLSLHELLKED